MNNLPLIGLGIATKSESGQTLDTFFPLIVFKGGEEKYDQCFDDWNALMSEDVIEVKDPLLLNLQDDDLSDSIDHLNDNQALILCRISDNKSIENTEEAYLKLHLISYKYFVPNSLNLENLFGHLVNVAWTNQGPIELEGIEKKYYLQRKKISFLKSILLINFLV